LLPIVIVTFLVTATPDKFSVIAKFCDAAVPLLGAFEFAALAVKVVVEAFAKVTVAKVSASAKLTTF